MIEAGDRVLVAASGGKDSTALLYFLAQKRAHFAVPFEMEALHVHTEFCRCGEHPEIWDLVRSWGVAVNRIEFSITGRLKEGKRMNCFWCATQRRTDLLHYADEHGFNKIAFGHHQDDILETFFMNMVYQGELATMLPMLKYDHYPQSIIRPLALVKESEIIEFAAQLGIARISCSCNHDSRSKRREARAHIEAMCRDKPYLKDNILRSMAHPNLRYLMVGEAAPQKGL